MKTDTNPHLPVLLAKYFGISPEMITDINVTSDDVTMAEVRFTGFATMPMEDFMVLVNHADKMWEQEHRS